MSDWSLVIENDQILKTQDVGFGYPHTFLYICKRKGEVSLSEIVSWVLGRTSVTVEDIEASFFSLKYSSQETL